MWRMRKMGHQFQIIFAETYLVLGKACLIAWYRAVLGLVPGSVAGVKQGAENRKKTSDIIIWLLKQLIFFVNLRTLVTDYNHEYFVWNCSQVNATEYRGDKSTFVQLMARQQAITYNNVDPVQCRIWGQYATY